MKNVSGPGYSYVAVEYHGEDYHVSPEDVGMPVFALYWQDGSPIAFGLDTVAEAYVFLEEGENSLAMSSTAIVGPDGVPLGDAP